MADFDIGKRLLFQGEAAEDTYSSVGQLVSNILPNVYITAGIVIFFMLVFGGFTMITNTNNADKQQEAGKIITGAIIGFIIVFASYWIIQLIEVLTGIPILST